MNRWKVRKGLDMFFDENHEVCYGPRWRVTSPTGVSWGNYATHAEAMSRADKQARTVEVTLPRDCRTIPLPPAFRHERPIELAWYEDFLIVNFTALGTCETIFIHRDEIKPLALALLAAANHLEREQS
ncbi:hypothetical protein ACEN2D_02270 [Corynebacterium auriscanis]|uniref:hypothetical protein n=1 Tax=Corynebacterium auriscanis TaxID=99807 RepID=UPI003CF6393B